MYKTKDKEGRKREKKRRSWGSRRSSYRQGIRQQRSKQATVQMELPGKVRDLCQICNWARTVTGERFLVKRLRKGSTNAAKC